MNALALIANIQSGRELTSSKEQLYLLVRGALLERLGGKIPPQLRSRMDPEDVLQAAFLRALGALDTFRADEDNAFVGWVYSIAKNLIADCSKRRSVAAQRFSHDATGGVRLSQVVTTRPRAESLVQRRDWIDAILEKLKGKEAEVIRLRWLQGLSFEEIAASWQKTPGAVQRFYSRVWQKFCELAKEERGKEQGTRES